MKLPALAALAALVSLAPSALAASPAVSRGEVLLAVGFDECMARARSTFVAEGYKVQDELDATSYTLARKEIHTAYITCSPAPDGKSWANIFVASYTQDGKIPGAQRLKLETRMAASAPLGNFSGTWSTNKDWASITLQQSGDRVTGRFARPGGSITGTVYGDTLVLEYKHDTGPVHGRAYMRITTGPNFEGRWCLDECDPKRATTTFTGRRK